METRTHTDDGTIQVRRNVRLAGVIGALALILAVLFLLRGGALAVVVGVVLAALAVLHLWSVWDGRVPLLLIDEQGVRLRLGRTWRGLPWSKVHEVEHTPRPAGLRRLWRDGRIAVLPVDEAAQLAELPRMARRWAQLSQRLYGVPFAVPLGLSTRVVGVDGDLTAALASLAGPTTGVVVIDETLEPEGDTGPVEAKPERTWLRPRRPSAGPSPEQTDGAPDAAAAPDAADVPDAAGAAVAMEATQVALPRVSPSVADRATAEAGDQAGDQAPDETAPEPVAAAPVAPLRAITQPVRVDVSYDAPIAPLSPEDTGTIPPIRDVDPIVDSGVVPAADPVIGPQLAAARTRIGLDVDQLAERTRIRPHVIEAMEVDDFGPCGGDFYARGHLRTLARVLGLDAAPLLAEYDRRYADAPVDPRAVFQAELASTGSARSLRRVNGGPNWSVLVAAVMAVVLIWSIARLVTAGDTTPRSAISLQAAGSNGTTNPYGRAAAPVPVTLTAAGGGARVVVRDVSGKVVYNGDLAFGQSKTVPVRPPLRVQTSDGSLRVAVAGKPATVMGKPGHSAQQTFTG